MLCSYALIIMPFVGTIMLPLVTYYAHIKTLGNLWTCHVMCHVANQHQQKGSSQYSSGNLLNTRTVHCKTMWRLGLC